MNVLIVFSHPRRNSLTRHVVDIFEETLSAKGHTVEIADLHSEGFDPVLREADEPDWYDPNKVYSEEVRREMTRIERNDATVMVYPVHWWSYPALLSGWIGRVWNNGWAYDASFFPQKCVWQIGIAGNDKPSFEKYGYDKSVHTQMFVGLLGYCHIEEPRTEILYDSLGDKKSINIIIERAKKLAAEF